MKTFRIIRLELVNYLRMKPSINRFVYSPGEEYTLQTILGTNGCGKSSLQNELWPLPADSNDFGPNGKKSLEIDFNGKHYVLNSIFETNKGKHEFVVDGVDLNDGNKIEMFRTLCEEHFGVTNEIKSLSLGKEVLSKMSPARRRYWMVKLADTDFTYAMERYNKLKEIHRDIQGSIKRLQKRLVDESNKLVDKEIVDKLKEELSTIKGIITDLYKQKNMSVEETSVVIERLNKTHHRFERLIRYGDQLDENKGSLEGFEHRNQLLSAIENLKKEVFHKQQMVQHLYEQHQSVKKKYDLLVKSGTESIDVLEKNKKELLDQIKEIKGLLIYPDIIPDGDPKHHLESFRNVYQQTVEMISTLPANDGYFSSKKAEEYEEKIKDLQNRIALNKNKTIRLQDELDHQTKHAIVSDITCPKCNHKWHNRLTDKDIANYENSLKELKEEYLKMEEEYKKYSEYLKEFYEYSNQYRNVNGFLTSISSIRNYLKEITKNRLLITNPSEVSQSLYSVLTDLEKHSEMFRMNKQVDRTNENIELKKSLSADTLENVEKELEKLTNDYSQLNKSLKVSMESVSEYENKLDLVDRYELHRKELLEALRDNNDDLNTYTMVSYQKLIDDVIMAVQTQLARREDVLSRINNQITIVEDIRKQIDEAAMNEEIAKAAHNALSPTTGAIAEGLNRSINAFIGKMNRIVNSIWTYPLEIQPFQMEDGSIEMDYRFPFKKHGESKSNKDVNEGSESMVKIFDFAFRLTALRKLGLDYLPLFLDEFEAPFDDIHRERAIYFIKKLVDEKAFNQIFMVSHYESNHGALSSLAQTCVLNKDNVLLPTNIVYNEHVNIN